MILPLVGCAILPLTTSSSLLYHHQVNPRLLRNSIRAFSILRDSSGSSKKTRTVMMAQQGGQQQQQQQQRGFKVLVVSLEGEKPKFQPVHKIINVSSFEELPTQKAMEKFTSPGGGDDNTKLLATVKVNYSTLNYKDGLVLQGKPGVAKSFPIVPGMDLAGEIMNDPTGTYAPGDNVIVTGNYLGQHLNGAYAEQCLVPVEWMLRQPNNLSGLQAMQIGTAGFTAMQSIDTLERFGKLNNNKDDKSTEKKEQTILVMGASGGVGSTAVSILSHLGYKNIIASTGGVEEHREMLLSLGASQVIPRLDPAKPLDKEEYDVVIDPVGGAATVNVLPRVKYGGAVALSGVAAGPSLDGSSVFPFILRGISLLGIDSVQMPPSERQRVWDRIANGDFPQKYFDVMMGESQVVGLDGLDSVSKDILKGNITGRVVVDISKTSTTSSSTSSGAAKL